MGTLVAKGLCTSNKYVMLESFTTDSLENQFGKLRQGQYGTYFCTKNFGKTFNSQTKLLLLLKEESRVLENLKSEYSCTKYGYLPCKYICDVFEYLPEFN